MYKILLVEDNLTDQLMVRTALADHNLYTCKSAREAMDLFAAHSFDLTILDVNLPDSSGLDLYRKLKGLNERQRTPTIFLTGNKSTEEIVLGLKTGADDYILKPFHFAELQARCENAILRNQQNQKQIAQLKCHNIEVNLQEYEAKVLTANGPVVLDLTSTEFKLLIFFLRNKDRLLTREQILNGVWGDAEKLSDRTVDARVASLRKKLGPASTQLMSIHGIGYKMSNEGRTAEPRSPSSPTTPPTTQVS